MHQQQQQEQQNGNAWGDVLAEKRGIQVVVFMWQMISVVMDKISVFDFEAEMFLSGVENLTHMFLNRTGLCCCFNEVDNKIYTQWQI